MPRIPERFPKGFDFGELISIDFSSPWPRQPLLLGDTAKVISPNNDFELLYYFPEPLSSKPASDLLIMINGFDEAEKGLFLYYTKPHSISKILGRVETPVMKKRTELLGTIACVLLPIPFHHWRRPLEPPYAGLKSAHMIDRDKIRFFLGFHQLLWDLDGLISQLNERGVATYATRFEPGFRLHLLGYSLGGLAALSAFLLDRLRGRNLITSCTLLASGVSFQEASMAVVDLEPAQMMAIKNYYLREPWATDFRRIVPKEHEGDELMFQVFNRVVLGNRPSGGSYARIDSQWIDSADDIIYITCTKDSVMDPRYIYHEVPEGAFKIHSTAVDVDHILHSDRRWMQSEGEKVIGDACDVMLLRSLARLRRGSAGPT